MEKSELSKQINDTLNQLKQNNLEVHSFSDQIIETSQNLGSATSLNQQSRTHLSQVQQDAKSLSAENEVLRQILASVKSEL